MKITNLNSKIKIENSRAKKIQKGKQSSLGKKCKRIHLTDDDSHKYSVAVKDNFIRLRKMVDGLLSMILGKRKFVPLKITNEKGKEQTVLVNINSLAKRLEISKENILETAGTGTAYLKNEITTRLEEIKVEQDRKAAVPVENLTEHESVEGPYKLDSPRKSTAAPPVRSDINKADLRRKSTKDSVVPLPDSREITDLKANITLEKEQRTEWKIELAQMESNLKSPSPGLTMSPIALELEVTRLKSKIKASEAEEARYQKQLDELQKKK